MAAAAQPQPDRTPVLVGVGDYTHRDKGKPVHPLEVLTIATERALASASPDEGVRQGLARLIDSVVVVQVNSFEYADGNERLPARLADAVGATPRRLEYTKVGGENPQVRAPGPRSTVPGTQGRKRADRWLRRAHGVFCTRLVGRQQGLPRLGARGGQGRPRGRRRDRRVRGARGRQ